MKTKYCLLQLTYFIVAFLISSPYLFAQENNCNYKKPHQADQWIFGKKARVDFTQYPLIVSPTNINYNTPYGVSSISDESGNLLFFSNGLNVWNQGLFKMDNGSGLNGNNFASQSSIIIPNPGNSKQYFIFTTDMFISPIYVDGVNYSVVDFTNSGYGTVTSKNNLLFNENSQKISAVKHENGNGHEHDMNLK